MRRVFAAAAGNINIVIMENPLILIVKYQFIKETESC